MTSEVEDWHSDLSSHVRRVRFINMCECRELKKKPVKRKPKARKPNARRPRTGR